MKKMASTRSTKLDISFFGQVYSLFSNVVNLSWKFDVAGRFEMPGVIDVSVENGMIVAECCLRDFDINQDLAMLANLTYESIMSVLNCYAFYYGCALSVVINEYQIPNSPRNMFNVAFAAGLGWLCESFNLGGNIVGHRPQLDTMMRLFKDDPNLALDLNDLISSISRPHIAPYTFFKVVEALRKRICSDGKPLHQWAVFKETLHISPNYLDSLNEISKAARHGTRTELAQSEINDIAKKTWRIFDRYLIYIKSGGKSLVDLGLPLLDETFFGPGANRRVLR